MKFTTTFAKLFAPLVLALTIMVFLIACKGEVGPKGDTGATGVAGAVGATGPAGVSGVAGVSGTSSVTQVTYATSFTLSNSLTQTQYILQLPRSITKAVVDNSLVIVYMQFVEPGNQVYQIPGVIPYFGDAFTHIIYSSNYSTPGIAQSIGIYRTSGNALKTVTLVRVLVIPAGTVINGRMAAVDYSNYEAVKAYYHLN